jgi:hypothetical protein
LAPALPVAVLPLKKQSDFSRALGVPVPTTKQEKTKTKRTKKKKEQKEGQYVSFLVK